MDVTLGQLEQISPELAGPLREEIRAGRLPAVRQSGVAGRPYVVRTEDLAESEQEAFRALAKKAESWSPRGAQHPVGRTGVARIREAASANRLEAWDQTWPPLLQMVESQHMMLRGLVDVLTHEMENRHDRIDRQQREIQELSYKLGQAHQDIGRLERALAERLARPQVEQA